MVPVQKGCALNIRPLEIVPKGKGVFIAMMKMPGGTILEMISEKKCWFCLSSPDVESHLVIKGEVELGKYKDALKNYYKNQEKAVVFFEWIFKSSPHANVQAVPVPLSKASNVQQIFNFAAKKLGFEFSMVSPSGDSSEARSLLRSRFDGTSNLFYVELPDGNILSHAVDDKQKFPVQFGREVLAGLLNIADRADWRNCKLSKEEELKMVTSFKKGFQQLDPVS
ncbi:hypothetical protein HPP92_009144 [Vanilla planifolia]|uniref:Uncharacterized protein n=1 Tax=Vanilla planifolia TaxID=51239 RepID=A0A835V616_VANPL|nr:hypothetical protein HPP92_009144 [Vanilla planifolia]